MPRLRLLTALLLCLALTSTQTSWAQQQSGNSNDNLPELVAASKRIVFLGDSITYAGTYVAAFETWLLTQDTTQDIETRPRVINVGLPSETVSGLSEAGHAGGKFPRPNLRERLERVLNATQPDLVIACYGMNCGIYQPFDEERFQKYQQGIKALKSAVEAAGAQLVLVTPPAYDDQRAGKSFSYNDVLGRYSQWLLEQRERGWHVIDLHGPMAEEVARQRQTDAEFTFQPDAVHPNAAGHWFIARHLIAAFGDVADVESPQAMLEDRQLPTDVYELVNKRMSLLRNAYLSEAGHQRPGIAAGMPLEEAEQQATALIEHIQTLLTAQQE